MGATTFYDVVKGSSAKDAFEKAVEEAQYEYGHGGYTGTIAEKDSFVMITPPFKATITVTPEMTTTEIKALTREVRKLFMDYAEQLIEDSDSRVDDKWGPAGCLEIKPSTKDSDGEYLFFGWASE